VRCLASSFGSAGDFLPTLAVAGALRRRGHDVRFVANPAYAARVAGAGLDLIPAGAAVDVGAKIEQNPATGTSAGRQRCWKTSSRRTSRQRTGSSATSSDPRRSTSW
jgi:UDP:flavonoid glycosyltransferase YjiC (YdhE family)